MEEWGVSTSTLSSLDVDIHLSIPDLRISKWDLEMGGWMDGWMDEVCRERDQG